MMVIYNSLIEKSAKRIFIIVMSALVKFVPGATWRPRPLRPPFIQNEQKILMLKCNHQNM